MANKKVNTGDTISVHYRGTLDDGTEFDSSYTRGEPLTFQVGAGQLIQGFDEAVVGMALNEVKNVTLTPDKAYGEVNSEGFQTVEKSAFPPDFPFQVDELVTGYDGNGRPMAARVSEVHDSTVTLDLNHPMAGKNLNFEIEVVGQQ